MKKLYIIMPINDRFLTKKMEKDTIISSARRCFLSRLANDYTIC